MNKPIPIGVEFYKEIIDNDYYYVDKTLLVKEIVDSHVKVTLFTRPRRFGKTLAMSMLKTYFEDEQDAEGNHIDNSHYFVGKKIAGCGKKYTCMQEQFPVINLSLKSAKQPEFEIAYNILVKNVMDEFGRHCYILEKNVLNSRERKRFQDIYEGKAAADEYATALAFLSKCLKKYHGRNTIILIDEYDVPLENAYFEGFYDEMIAFIRSLFESAFKTNDSLEFGVITGCLRISKESIFTGLNNLKVNSILQEDCAECYGFTPAEVSEMLGNYHLKDCLPEMQKWYDGYLFGNTEVYNPWSVINYIYEKRINSQAFPRPYWSNTSSNSIVRQLVEKADLLAKKEIEQLIAGGTIEKPVQEDITYGDIYESQDNLWNFLFFTGYLKKAGERQDGRTVYLRMAVPNEEILYIYENTILFWFNKRVKALDRTPLYQALIEGDCPTVEKTLKRQLMESISFYDEAEQFYHGFMIGMLGGLGEYILHSNRESGDGRADAIMEPLDVELPVLIFEFKHTEKLTQLEGKCETALLQIEEKHYDAEYKEMGYERFVKYGICFFRKTCRVMALIEK